MLRVGYISRHPDMDKDRKFNKQARMQLFYYQKRIQLHLPPFVTPGASQWHAYYMCKLNNIKGPPAQKHMQSSFIHTNILNKCLQTWRPKFAAHFCNLTNMHLEFPVLQ